MNDEPKPKRKTHTSTAVKERYNSKAYSPLKLYLKTETAEAYRAKCDAMGISYSEILHKAVEDFLKNE